MQLKLWFLAGHAIVKPESGEGDGGDTMGVPKPVSTECIVVVTLEVEVEVDVVEMQFLYLNGKNQPKRSENQPHIPWLGGQKGIVVVDLEVVVLVEMDIDDVELVVEVDVVVEVDTIIAIAFTLAEDDETTATNEINITADNSTCIQPLIPISTIIILNIFSSSFQ